MAALKASKPGWRAAFKTENEVNFYKRELLKACVENGISSLEKIEKGMVKARRDDSDFFPSVGKFIGWCLGADECWEHKGPAYREWRPERMLPKVTDAELKQIGNEHLAKMREMLKNKSIT